MSKKKKKGKQNNRFISFLIALLFPILAAYALIVQIQVFVSRKDYLDIFLDYEGNYGWIRSQAIEYQAPLLLAMIALFIVIMNMTNKKESGYKDASDHGAYGNAQLSSIDDLWNIEKDSKGKKRLIAGPKESKWSGKDALKTLESSSGIILGREDENLVIIPPDSSLDNRNVLVVGSSGSSKGQAFVINNILNNKDETIVVTDPKGELFNLTADIKKDQGYRVYQIDFLELAGHGFNPLDYVYNDEYLDINAKKIAQSIARNASKDDKEDHWFTKAVDLLTGLIVYAKMQNPKANIPVDVKRLFAKISEDEEYLSEVCEEIGEEHPAYQYLKDFSVAQGNERASILSTFTKQVGIFSSQKVSKMTRESGFDFHDLQEHKSILYVKIPVKGNPVQALTATFFDQLFTVLYNIGDANGKRLNINPVINIPTMFMLDEFANLGKINEYDELLSTCRGYGISLLTIVQDFAQLEGKYSKEIARTIINNHDTTLFLRTKDPETAKFFERLSGDTTIEFKTSSTSNSGGGFFGDSKASSSKSTNQQLIKKPLIAEYEFMQMQPDDKCYVFVTGKVIQLQKAYQSLIYKDFLTGSQKVKVGETMVFPYVYPEKRAAYIKKFKLNPYKEEVALKEKEPIKLSKPIETTESEVIEQGVASNEHLEDFAEPVTPDKKEEAIESLVSDFFSEINKKEAARKSKAQTVQPKPLPSTTEKVETAKQALATQDAVDLSEVVSEEIYGDDDIVSDPEALHELQSLAVVLPNKVEDSNQAFNTVQDFSLVLGQLHLSEEFKTTENIVKYSENEDEETNEDEELINIDEELPM